MIAEGAKGSVTLCLNISGDSAMKDSSGCHRQTLAFDARLQLLSAIFLIDQTKRRHMVMLEIGNAQ